MRTVAYREGLAAGLRLARAALSPVAVAVLLLPPRPALGPANVALVLVGPGAGSGSGSVTGFGSALALDLAVELRPASWFGDAAAAETVTFLRDHDLGMVCVDMPQGHPSSVPPIMVATAEPAVVRFHGHSAHWEGGSKEDRFRYAYSDDELRRWAELLTDLAEHSDEIDEAAAAEARKRAEAQLGEVKDPVDIARVRAALQTALMRERIATRRRSRG